MKVKLKDGRVLPIEEGSYIALDDHGETLEVKDEEIESFIDNKVDFNKIRVDITMEVLKKLNRDDIGKPWFEVTLCKKVDDLIKELKEYM